MAERPRLRSNGFKLVPKRYTRAWWAGWYSPHTTKLKGSWDYIESGDEEKDNAAVAFTERLDAEGK